jgi:hypothetical protein
MKYAKIINNSIDIFPYTWETLQSENPHSVFDDRFTLAEWYDQTENSNVSNANVVEVLELPIPTIDPNVFNLSPPTIPEFIDGAWVLAWKTTEKTPEEKAAFQALNTEYASQVAGNYVP